MDRASVLRAGVLALPLFALLFVLWKVAPAPSSSSPPHLAAMSGGTRPPIINPNWTVAAWFIDPANTTTCASDKNTCTSATCAAGSVGPCLTWSEINYGRWGCLGDPQACPRIAQDTTITFLSSQSRYDDRIIFHPSLDAVGGSATSTHGPTVVLTGTLTAGAPITFNVSHAKARASNQPLKNTALLAQGALWQNTNRANSWGWSTGWAVGNTAHQNVISQPLSPIVNTTGGLPLTIPTENDTWATNDSVTPQTPSTANFVDVRPTFAGLTGQGMVIVENFVIPENTAQSVPPGDDDLLLGNHVEIAQSWIQKHVVLTNWSTNFLGETALINCAMDGGFLGNVRAASRATSTTTSFIPPQIFGGYIVAAGPLGGTGTIALSGVWLDLDILLRVQVGGASGSTIDFSGTNWIGTACIESPAAVDFGVLDLKNRAQQAATNVVYGIGQVDAWRGQVQYPSGATGGTTALPLPLRIATGTVGCVTIPTAAARGLCNTSLTPGSALDTALGASTGCVGFDGAGSFCNLPVP
jgi:hypothetical protein